MTATILMRRAPLGRSSPWDVVAEVRSTEEAEDELMSWRGPRLSHGDLVRVAQPRAHELRVFDADSGALIAAPMVPGGRGGSPSTVSWLAFWEGPEFSADAMLRACGRVDRRRVALVAHDCAAMVVSSIASSQQPLSVIALDAVEAWVVGVGSVDDVRRAARRAYLGTSTSNARRTHALYAVSGACETVTDQSAVEGGLQAVGGAEHVAAGVTRSVMMVAATAPASVQRAWFRRMVKIVRDRIPLAVVLCARLGLRDPVPFRATGKGGVSPR